MRIRANPFLLLAFGLAMSSPAIGELFPQGLASGDVTASSAVVWTRTTAPAELQLEWTSVTSWQDAQRRHLTTAAKADNTVQAQLTDLEPGTQYRYRFLGPEHASVEGSFRTAPAPGQSTDVHFLVGGDLGGQTFCRHEERGYAIFRPMASEQADFFIANGDMIYADNPCPAQGIGDWRNLPGGFPGIADVDWSIPGAARENLLAHWRYNRADPHHRAFLAQTPIYVQWDDHEVINDFGLPWPEWPDDPERQGWRTLVEAGLETLHLFNPIRVNADEPQRIYRSFRWGRDVEIFLLDARSYRSANDLADRPANQKRMLGPEQVTWLKKSLIESTATWKIISSDVPLSLPTGSQAQLKGRDGFANGQRPDYSSRTGAERELLSLLTSLDQANVENMIFVVTDVHLATNLLYSPDLDGDGDRLRFHELVNGPLNAISLPTAAQLDPTLTPTVLYAEGGFFNYSDIRISGRRLTATIRDQTGQVREGSKLEISAR